MEYSKPKEVNKRLKQIYGTNLRGDSIFRVSFSDEQKEKRFGKFAEWYGKIFLREFSGLREVPKYPWIRAKWVLERWIPPVYAHTPDIPETSQGSYEPIYVFQTAEGVALPVSEEFAHTVIFKLFHPDLPGHRKSVMETEEEVAFEKEVELNKMILENASPYLCNMLHGGEAIVRP